MSVARGRPGVIAIAAVLGVVVGVAATAGLIAADGGGGRPVRDLRGPSGAAAYAEQLLDRVPLPKGAVPFTGSLPEDVADAPMRSMIGNQVARHRVYRVPTTYSTVFLETKARGVPGLSCGGYGWSESPAGEMTSPYFDCGSLQSPPGIYQSQVIVGTTEYGAKSALLRLDAQVVWRPIRPASERVPDSDRVVTIDRTVSQDHVVAPPEKKHGVVTDPAVVASLIRLFNGLPGMPLGGESSMGCETEFEVKFAETTSSTPDVSLVGSGCRSFGWGVTVRGQRQADLSNEDGSFINALNAALQG